MIMVVPVPNIERVPTGVEKLDEALEGGIPKGAWVVIAGEPGTGKTVLTQMIARESLMRGYKLAVLSTEMTLSEWRTQAERLGLEIDGVAKLRAVRGGNTEVVDGVFADMRDLIDTAKMLGKNEGKWVPYLSDAVLRTIVGDLLRSVSSMGRYGPINNTVLIIDSISMFYLHAPNTAAKIVLDLMTRYKNANLTVVMTTQYAFTTGGTFGARAEHVADGVIHMWMDNVEKVKEVRRYLIIKKMRATNHSLKAFRVKIEPGRGLYLEDL